MIFYSSEFCFSNCSSPLPCCIMTYPLAHHWLLSSASPSLGTECFLAHCAEDTCLGFFLFLSHFLLLLLWLSISALASLSSDLRAWRIQTNRSKTSQLDDEECKNAKTQTHGESIKQLSHSHLIHSLLLNCVLSHSISFVILSLSRMLNFATLATITQGMRGLPVQPSSVQFSSISERQQIGVSLFIKSGNSRSNSSGCCLCLFESEGAVDKCVRGRRGRRKS